MSQRFPTYATMVTNFDSTAQQHEWEAIRRRYAPDGHGLDTMWLKNDSERRCEHLLNEHAEFATHFAGIIRTAYLYCPRIMLTDAELFDGVFFLALGPTTVNGILGRSYKDGPSIIISGRAPTMQKALEAFTLSTAVGTPKHRTEDGPGPTPAPLTIRPLRYSALGVTVTADDAAAYPQSFRTMLAERIEQAHRTGAPTAPIIAEAFARVLHSDEKNAPETGHAGAPADRFRFLGQRWQEWIDAERQGLVLYENQTSPEVRARVHSPGFGSHFARNADRYRELLERAYRLPASGHDGDRDAADHDSVASDEATFSKTLQTISEQPKRSDAFLTIEAANLPSGREPDADEQESGSAHGVIPAIRRLAARLRGHVRTSRPQRRLTRMMLRDWYQFVYQRSLADHLGAELISVTAPNNSFIRIVGRDRHQTSLTLDGSITRQLAGMPFIRFTLFCYESRTAIASWRACASDAPTRRKLADTRNIAYAVEQATQERSLKNDARHIFWGAGLAGVLALLSALSDNVWLTGNAPIWLIVLAAWAIAIVPNAADVLTWLNGVHSASKTVVSLSGAYAADSRPAA